MRWLAWIRRPWIVAGVFLTLLVAAVYVGGQRGAVVYRSTGVSWVAWRGVVSVWWHTYPDLSGRARLGWDAYGHRQAPLWLPRFIDSAPTLGFVLPLWILLLLVGPISLWAAWRTVRYPPGSCQRCGYDLRGQPAGATRCPECGDAEPTVHRLALPHRPTRRMTTWMIATPLAVLALFTQSLWTDLTWYAGGGGPNTFIVAGPQLSIRHGGVFWRSSVQSDLLTLRVLHKGSAPAPPGLTGPDSVTRWKLASTDLWLLPRFDSLSDGGYDVSVVFLPGWSFALAAAALAWLIGALLPRRISAPGKGVAL